jgi:phage shock protein A
MARTLFTRITTLLKADAHGVIESLEERSLLLKQYVREAELELHRKQARLDAIREEDRRLREALERCESEARSLDEDVRLALGSGKEDLARFAVRRLLPRRAEAKSLAARIAEHADEATALAAQLAKQHEQFEALRTRVRAELAREPERGDRLGASFEAVVTDEEVELELLRRRTAEGGA